MSKRYLLIINPISGTGGKDRVPLMVEETLRPLGVEVSVHYTTGPGDATVAAARAVSEGFDAVLAAGGDGTINETAKALINSDVALGIIPSGSGNGLARHLGVPIDHRRSIELIARGHTERIDYCTADDKPFFCTFGMGFDAAVSHRFAHQSHRGPISYVASAIEEYVTYRPETYAITVNGETVAHQAFLVAVCNASQWGNNAYIAPRASICDGMLDIAIVHSGSPLDAAVMGIELFSGHIADDTSITTLRAPSAVIERLTGGPAHIDGEPLTLPERVDVECHRSGLKVLCTHADPDFQPIITPLRSMFNQFKIALEHVFG